MIVPNGEVIASFSSLSREDLILLNVFYKNKLADTELEYLKLQINSENRIKKVLKENLENIANIKKEKEDQLNIHDSTLKKQIDELNKKILNLSNKKRITTK